MKRNWGCKLFTFMLTQLMALALVPATALGEGENQAPVNSVPAEQVMQRDQTLVFSAAGSNAISVSDADAGEAPVQITLSATNGTISLGSISGLALIAGSGTGDITMTFSGSLSDVNAALSGLAFLPTAGYTGPASLQITTSDNGASGSGGAMTDSDTIPITILPLYHVNDFTKLQAFLDQPSSVAGKTNGQCLNASYNRHNPNTWSGVQWNNEDPKRVVTIGLSLTWFEKPIAGPLDLSGFTALTKLQSGYTQISALNLSGDTALTYAGCTSSLLTSVNVDGTTSLATLILDRNLFTALDVSGAAALTRLECRTNLLSKLDVSANAALKNLMCGGNPFTSLDVSANEALEVLNCFNGNLTSLNVRGLTALTDLTAAGNALETIDVSTNTTLTGLHVWDNRLTELDVSNNQALRYLYCERNLLTGLDLSRNNGLVYLYANDNQIEELDLSGCAALTNLYCRNNRLSSLDAADSTGICYIYCEGNPLTRVMASIVGGSVSITANGNGTVLLSYAHRSLYYAEAYPNAGSGFSGWASSVNPGSSDARYNMNTGNSYNLTADFTYTVTFDKNGGDTDATPASMAVISGALIPAPADPTRTGFVLDGWYQEPECETEWDMAADTVSSDITLFAKWAPVPITGIPHTQTMYRGGRIKFNPQPAGGTWDWDETFFSASFNSPATFTALKEGASVITYTVNGVAQGITVTVLKAELPGTGQDITPVLLLGGLGVLALAAGLALKKGSVTR